MKPKAKKILEAAYLLETPAWKNLWPLATLTLFLGCIIGGFLTFERLYAPDSVLPVALVAIIFYLRPQRIPITTAIGVALFTAVIGIFMLLEFFGFLSVKWFSPVIFFEDDGVGVTPLALGIR